DLDSRAERQSADVGLQRAQRECADSAAGVRAAAVAGRLDLGTNRAGKRHRGRVAQAEMDLLAAEGAQNAQTGQCQALQAPRDEAARWRLRFVEHRLPELHAAFSLLRRQQHARLSESGRLGHLAETALAQRLGRAVAVLLQTREKLAPLDQAVAVGV